MTSYINDPIVEKDENSLYWVMKFDDVAYNIGDVRRKSHNFVPEIILDEECDHAIGGALTYTVSPIGLGGNLSRVDLISPLAESELICRRNTGNFNFI